MFLVVNQVGDGVHEGRYSARGVVHGVNGDSWPSFSGSLFAMRGRLLLIVLVVLLSIAVCGPLFERVDHWDHFPQYPNDIVITLTVLVACVAIWLLLSPVAIAQLSSLGKS